MLQNKKIIWNGDSICIGNRINGGDDRDSWATRIAAKYNMQFKNYAVGGGTVAENLPLLSNGNPRHSVSATLEKMYAEHPDSDYIIFEGGTNDADLLASQDRLGCFNQEDFSGDYDKNTFSGALESVFYRSVSYWHGKKIGYIVAHKMGPNKSYFVTRRIYFERAIEICEKWGIPYLDLWSECHLNPFIKSMYDLSLSKEQNETDGKYYIDGQHLTSTGYAYTTEIVEKWLKTL